MKQSTGIVWLRQDLRLADQPAFAAAAARHQHVVPLYIWAPEEEGEWAPGSASKWWLHYSLSSLKQDLRGLGSDLVVRTGPTLAALKAIIQATGATHVYLNDRYEPQAALQTSTVLKALHQLGVISEAFSSALLHDPELLRSQMGSPYLVYGAFWRKLVAQPIEPGAAAPRQLPPLPKIKLASVPVTDLGLLPLHAWDHGIRAAWSVGEAAAQAALQRFCAANIAGYESARDIPGYAGTSRLSPHLHYGEISPRQAWVVARAATGAGRVRFLQELAWREFSYYLLHHFPHLSNAPLRKEFSNFPWVEKHDQLKAWQRGMTGYPIVDAGMRELWHTGWMHNRVRMIVASFLVKDLRQPWLAGARWFWDTLVDADLASNTQGWQWTSGCGADAAPYFRVFNPVLQGKKFDPDGVYVRRWVPEIATLSNKAIHAPWETAHGLNYPPPIVDHAQARFSALHAFAQIKNRPKTLSKN